MRLNQLVLFISKCPEEYTGAKHIEMSDGGGSIGRAAGCTLSLKDHNRFISSTHCLVSAYGDTYYISDVSTNGTMVNGHKILKNQPVSICDGDIITLGQYEIGVAFERVSAEQDIASDIAPERVSSDPLLTLGDVVTRDETHSDDVEDLFIETKQDDIDCHDPIEHLTFSMQREDDYLIRDESELDRASPKPIKHVRQIADDSLSIHSEFDTPNLIPEDWMAGSASSKATFTQSNTLNENEIIPEDFQKDPIISRTDKTKSSSQNSALQKAQQIHNKDSNQKTVDKNWEDVTQAITPAKFDEQLEQPETPTKVGHLNSTSDKQSSTIPANEISQAFLKDLGSRTLI